jgi:hypothetical protein
LTAFSRTPDVLLTYRRWAVPVVPSEFLLDEIRILLAAFPETALSIFRKDAADASAPWPQRVLAMDALSVLARGGHPEVRKLYLEVLTRGGKGEAEEWAAALLGHYYHGDDVKSALFARAVDGSPAATEAMGYYLGVDERAWKAAGDSHREALGKLARRAALQREPEVRRLLGEVIRGDRVLNEKDRKGDRLWAMECAARQGYSELAPLIREAIPDLAGSGAEPGEWEFWEMSARDLPVAEAVRALARLGPLRELEKRYFDYALLSGSRESAKVAIDLRKKESSAIRDIGSLFELLPQ